jgi:2-polyprenyl-3-methyl-5-hydroxy-6-metoxy-1,4-benzoquinol methylase
MTRSAHALTTEGGDRCPACGSEARPKIDLADYCLFDCPSCGSWSSDALARRASSSFEPTRYFSHAESDVEKWDTLWNRLGWTDRASRAVLDVGCGTGAYLVDLRSRLGGSSRCEGIELDAERVALARRSNPGARIHEGDVMTALSRTGSPFDLITLWDVFEHLAAPRVVLAELARALAPGGAIYLQTIHENSLLPAFGRWVHRISGGRLLYPARRTHEAHHLVFFSRRALDSMAREAGLRVRAVWFDRLARERMDGHPFVTGAAALLLAAENRLGNGLFINLILERGSSDPSGVHAR